jgi:hypothetical protein
VIRPGKFEIRWIDRGHPPRQPANPHYPDGCNLNLTGDGEAKLPHPQEAEPKVDHCIAQLPYPSGHDNVGTWVLRCLICGSVTGVTAASRPDDARSVKIPCKELVPA